MFRVALTGVGVVSPLGNTFEDVADALTHGRGAIGPYVANPESGVRMAVAAEVARDFFDHHFEPSSLSLLDRISQFAVIATRRAMRMSGLDWTQAGGDRVAAIMGSGMGGAESLEENYQRLYLEKLGSARPLVVLRGMFNAPLSHITIEHGIRGPSFMVASACSSSNHAIGMAFGMIRSAIVDAAVVGGAEACMTVGCIKGWEALRVMASDTCRPFSRDRQGMVLGEGAGMFVMERWEHAIARGADILAEVVGFGMSTDASHISRPNVQGPVAAIDACLASAGMPATKIDYVNAHGTGTTVNDIVETQALHRALGEHARRVPVSSTKSMHGHALGAAGALEMVATLAALRGQFVPPTINFNEADPRCDLDYVPNEARSCRVDVAMSNSFAFGGHNAVVAVARPGR